MRVAPSLAVLALLLAAALLAAPATAQGRLPAVSSNVVSALAENNCAQTTIANVQDRTTALSQDRTTQRDIEMDIDRTMIGLILMDQGATDISHRSLQNTTTLYQENDTIASLANVDRESVFSALSLGIGGLTSSLSALDALACASTITATAPLTETYRRTIDLDIDNALMASALTRRGANPANLRDIATIHETNTLTDLQTQDVSLAARDALLLLTLR